MRFHLKTFHNCNSATKFFIIVVLPFGSKPIWFTTTDGVFDHLWLGNVGWRSSSLGLHSQPWILLESHRILEVFKFEFIKIHYQCLSPIFFWWLTPLPGVENGCEVIGGSKQPFYFLNWRIHQYLQSHFWVLI